MIMVYLYVIWSWRLTIAEYGKKMIDVVIMMLIDGDDRDDADDND